MPRGIPKVKEAVEMTEQELDAIETNKEIVATVAPVKVVGSLSKSKLSTEEVRNREQANKLFPYTPCKKDGWINMTLEEMAEYEKQGILKGYDPAANIGLIKKN